MSVRGRDRSDTERLKKQKKYRTSAVSASRGGFGTTDGGRIVRVRKMMATNPEDLETPWVSTSEVLLSSVPPP